MNWCVIGQASQGLTVIVSHPTPALHNGPLKSVRKLPIRLALTGQVFFQGTAISEGVYMRHPRRIVSKVIDVDSQMLLSLFEYNTARSAMQYSPAYLVRLETIQLKALRKLCMEQLVRGCARMDKLALTISSIECKHHVWLKDSHQNKTYYGTVVNVYLDDVKPMEPTQAWTIRLSCTKIPQEL